MNSKYLPLAFIAVGLAAGVALWLWATSPAPAPAEALITEAEPAPALPPDEPAELPPIPDVVVVAAPVLAPVSAPAPALTFDPQTELGTAI